MSTCRSGTPAKVSRNANSLAADENTRDVIVWLIKAYDYNQSRVLNVLFCTRYIGPPFFSRAIPTYGVLPYSMISIYVSIYLYFYKVFLHLPKARVQNGISGSFLGAVFEVVAGTKSEVWTNLP